MACSFIVISCYWSCMLISVSVLLVYVLVYPDLQGFNNLLKLGRFHLCYNFTKTFPCRKGYDQIFVLQNGQRYHGNIKHTCKVHECLRRKKLKSNLCWRSIQQLCIAKKEYIYFSYPWFKHIVLGKTIVEQAIPI